MVTDRSCVALSLLGATIQNSRIQVSALLVVCDVQNLRIHCLLKMAPYFQSFFARVSSNPSGIPYISLAKCSNGTSRPRTSELLLDWTRVIWLYQQIPSLQYSVSLSVFLLLCWLCGMSSKTGNGKTPQRLVGTNTNTPKDTIDTAQSNFSHKNRGILHYLWLLLSTNHKRAMRYEIGSVKAGESFCG